MPSSPRPGGGGGRLISPDVIWERNIKREKRKRENRKRENKDTNVKRGNIIGRSMLL
jgi:hypothetical protein